MKREGNSLTLELMPTNDIAATLGKTKRENQRLIGFALESNDSIINANKKLQAKNLDFIVLNEAGKPGIGFHADTNKITIIDKQNNTTEYPLKTKTEVANDIINKLETLFI